MSRTEGSVNNKPGRKPGIEFVHEISAEGAATRLLPRFQRSLDRLHISRPDGRAYSLPILRT
jgi:hypothetical protein